MTNYLEAVGTRLALSAVAGCKSARLAALQSVQPDDDATVQTEQVRFAVRCSAGIFRSSYVNRVTRSAAGWRFEQFFWSGIL